MRGLSPLVNNSYPALYLVAYLLDDAIFGRRRFGGHRCGGAVS